MERAADVRVAVQFVDPAPVKVLLAHVNALNEGETVDPDPLSLIEVVLETEPALAVRVTVCEAVTAETAAANGALVAPDATVTDAGTVTAVLLLARFTTMPVEGAAAVSVTVQLSVPAAIIDELVQLTMERDGVPEFDPFPCSFIVLDHLAAVVEVGADVRLMLPVESVVVVGSY